MKVSAEFLSSEDNLIQNGVIEEVTDRLFDHHGEIYANDTHVFLDNAQVSITVECGVIEVECHTTDEDGKRLNASSSYFIGSNVDEAIDTAVTFLLAVRENTGNDAD